MEKHHLISPRPFRYHYSQRVRTQFCFQFLEETFNNLRELGMSNELITEAIFATYQHVGFTLLGK